VLDEYDRSTLEACVPPQTQNAGLHPHFPSLNGLYPQRDEIIGHLGHQVKRFVGRVGFSITEASA